MSHEGGDDTTAWGPPTRAEPLMPRERFGAASTDGGDAEGGGAPGERYLTRAMASISTLTSLGSRAAWTVARAGLGALKNSA